MPTRYNTNAKYRYGNPPLRSGYEKQSDSPNYTIPSCGLEDLDSGIFNLFDKEINPQYGGFDGFPLTKVPILFAAGEKWALLKRGRPLRDRNNTLIIPLITIMRQEVKQDMTKDVTGRGINQQTGEFVVTRRLSNSDRAFQNLINKLSIVNQPNVAMPQNRLLQPDQPTTTGQTGDSQKDADIRDGSALLKPGSVGKNIYETIVVPSPQFYTAVFKVTVWTQYMQHANQIVEKIVSSYLPQAQSWRIDTQKGYWFIAKVDDASFEVETNFDDMSTTERYIKYNFTVEVPAYLFATKTPGSPVPLKRYVSAPVVNFETVSAGDIFDTTQYVIGSDDPSLPLTSQHSSEVNNSQVYSASPSMPARGGNGNSMSGNSAPRSWIGANVFPVSAEQNSEDPANIQYASQQRGRPVTVTKHVQGERTYRGIPLSDFEIVLNKL